MAMHFALSDADHRHSLRYRPANTLGNPTSPLFSAGVCCLPSKRSNDTARTDAARSTTARHAAASNAHAETRRRKTARSQQGFAGRSLVNDLEWVGTEASRRGFSLSASVLGLPLIPTFRHRHLGGFSELYFWPLSLRLADNPNSVASKELSLISL